MGNWGDDWDPEVVNKEEPKGRYTLNFKKITADMDNIIAETSVVDNKHPKMDLLMEWAGALTGCFILFLCSYKVFVFVTLPFFAFYMIALYRIGSAWRQFKYNAVIYWLMTIPALGVLFAIAYMIQQLVAA